MINFGKLPVICWW